MALLKPNETYTINGVTVNEKIIPDGTRWKDAAKAVKAGFSVGAPYKKGKKLTNNTGKPQTVTIHNTDDIANVTDDGEQYTRATYNENMKSARVHFYVDDICAWQNLKAGTGMAKNDPNGSAEIGWHAGDSSVSDGGNMTSLSIEIIMNDTATHDRKARDNGARLAAWLLWKHGLPIDRLVTHTYWVNKLAGRQFRDVDEQCTNLVSGKKWCPSYIFGSTNHKKALAGWKSFKSLVKEYLDSLNKSCGTVSENPKKNQNKLKSYTVRVTSDKLKIRKGAGTDYACVGYITDKGVYTIIEEKTGKGAAKWGRLKSDAGWISLDKVKKL